MKFQDFSGPNVVQTHRRLLLPFVMVRDASLLTMTQRAGCLEGRFSELPYFL